MPIKLMVVIFTLLLFTNCPPPTLTLQLEVRVNDISGQRVFTVEGKGFSPIAQVSINLTFEPDNPASRELATVWTNDRGYFVYHYMRQPIPPPAAPNPSAGVPAFVARDVLTGQFTTTTVSVVRWY